MFFTKTTAGFRAWFFAIQSDGILRTGLVDGDFTVTVVDSSDSFNLAPVVVESTQKPGMYYFDIPSTFFSDHGVGEYVVGVQIDCVDGPSGPPFVRTAFTQVLRVYSKDFENIEALESKVDAVAADVVVIRKIEEGDWEQIGNQLIYYDVDGSTVLEVWDLFNAAGQPAMIDVVKRVKHV